MPNSKGCKNSTPEEIELILDLIKRGYKQIEIVKKVGKSEEVVSRIYRNWLGDYRELLRDCKRPLKHALSLSNRLGERARIKGVIERIDLYFEREEERKDAKKGGERNGTCF